MIKLALTLLFLYVFFAYALRWFVISNSSEYFKKYGSRTIFTDFFKNFSSTIYLFFLEYCSYILGITLLVADYIYSFFSFLKTEGPYVEVQSDEPPILLIHGYMMRGWSLMYLKKRLEKDGWSNVYTWSYIPPFKSIPDYAEQLKREVDKILKNGPHDKVVLIGHSMGGLLARHYINHLQGKSHVEKLVTLGTPHKGTQLWSFTYSPCGVDMRPGSDFLKKLRAVPAGIETLSIYSSFDEIIIPYQNCHLSGKNVLNKKFDDLGHMMLIFSSKVYEEIRSFLFKENHLDKKNHK